LFLGLSFEARPLIVPGAGVFWPQSSQFSFSGCAALRGRPQRRGGAFVFTLLSVDANRCAIYRRIDSTVIFRERPSQYESSSPVAISS
jgi:hypothetical protein